MKFFSLVVILFLSANTIFADVKDEKEIQKVISQQISSFQADDFENAFTFASQSIKDIFGNSENFGMMVRQGFPMVWRTKNVLYLDLISVNGIPVQRVMVTDINDEIYTLNYMMLETAEGWRIRGVTIDNRPST